MNLGTSSIIGLPFLSYFIFFGCSIFSPINCISTTLFSGFNFNKISFIYSNSFTSLIFSSSGFNSFTSGLISSFLPFGLIFSFLSIGFASFSFNSFFSFSSFRIIFSFFSLGFSLVNLSSFSKIRDSFSILMGFILSSAFFTFLYNSLISEGLNLVVWLLLSFLIYLGMKCSSSSVFALISMLITFLDKTRFSVSNPGKSILSFFLLSSSILLLFLSYLGNSNGLCTNFWVLLFVILLICLGEISSSPFLSSFDSISSPNRNVCSSFFIFDNSSLKWGSCLEVWLLFFLLSNSISSFLSSWSGSVNLILGVSSLFGLSSGFNCFFIIPLIGDFSFSISVVWIFLSIEIGFFFINSILITFLTGFITLSLTLVLYSILTTFLLVLKLLNWDTSLLSSFLAKASFSFFLLSLSYFDFLGES